MALIDCQECGGKVSTAALSCPHCGYPQQKVEHQEVGALAAPAKKGSTQRIPLPAAPAVGSFPGLAAMPVPARQQRLPLQERFKVLGEDSFSFQGDYAEVFKLVERAFYECGVAIEESSLPGGFIHGKASYGITVWGIQVQATFYSTGDDVRLEIRAILSEMFDYFGGSRKKVQQISHRVCDLVREDRREQISSGLRSIMPPSYACRQDISYKGRAKAGFWLCVAGGFAGPVAIAGLIMSSMTLAKMSASNNKEGQTWAYAALIVGMVALMGWFFMVID